MPSFRIYVAILSICFPRNVVLLRTIVVVVVVVVFGHLIILDEILLLLLVIVVIMIVIVMFVLAGMCVPAEKTSFSYKKSTFVLFLVVVVVVVVVAAAAAAVAVFSFLVWTEVPPFHIFLVTFEVFLVRTIVPTTTTRTIVVFLTQILNLLLVVVGTNEMHLNFHSVPSFFFEQYNRKTEREAVQKKSTLETFLASLSLE